MGSRYALRQRGDVFAYDWHHRVMGSRAVRTSNIRLMRVCMAGLNARGYGGLATRLPEYADYEAACQLLRSERLFYPSEFAPFMREDGFTVLESFWDLPELGRIWLRQTGADESIQPVGLDLVMHQIEEFRAEIVYFHPVFIIDAEQRRAIRERFPFVRAIGGYCGYLPDDSSFFADCDFLFSAFRQPLSTWRSAGVAAHLLHHGFDDQFISAGAYPTVASGVPLTFFGTTGWGLHTYFRRYRLLRRLLERTDLMIWGMEPDGAAPKDYPPWTRFYRRHFTQPEDRVRLRDMQEGKHRPWFKFVAPLGNLFPERLRAPVYDRAYLQLLAGSTVTVNCHTSVSEEGLNMRLFEATGVGACLLTDTRDGLEELFEPDKEIMVYDSIAECIDKARFLRRNDSVRRRIAQAGRERTLRDHTSRARLRIVADALHSLA